MSWSRRCSTAGHRGAREPPGAFHGPLPLPVPALGRAGFRSARPPLPTEAGSPAPGVLSGWTSDRRDFELNFLYFAPDAEFEFPSEMQTLGLVGSFRGHEGRMEAISKIFEVWGSELEPAYTLDLGDRVLNLGFWRTQGRASGVPLEQELAQLVTLRDGLITRDQNFFSWEEGLRAAGLDRMPSPSPHAQRQVKQQAAPGRAARVSKPHHWNTAADRTPAAMPR